MEMVFNNRKSNFETLQVLLKETTVSLLINGTLYQNAGATIVQQIAYIMAHTNEYFNRVKKKPIVLQVAVGTILFEIAKLRAIRSCLI
jgi:methylmalonyl-CoA mutase